MSIGTGIFLAGFFIGLAIYMKDKYLKISFPE